MADCRRIRLFPRPINDILEILICPKRISGEIFFRNIFVDFVWLIFNLLPDSLLGRASPDAAIIHCKTTIYELFLITFPTRRMGSKVIHTAKNLFCNVPLICNLVQEFNGLVSKGPAI